jgi:hypothetical protein
LARRRGHLACEFSADIGDLGSLLSIVPLPKGGTGRLFVDGKRVAEGRLAHFGSFGSSFSESFDIGRDRGSPVSLGYEAPFAFTGTLQELRLELR